MATAGELTVRITGDTSDLRTALTQANASVETFSRKVSSAGDALKQATRSTKTFSESWKGLAVAGGIVGAFGAAVGLAGTTSLKEAGNFEQTRIAMNSLLGSTERAAKMLGELSRFAARTPFELPQLATAAKQLLGVGFAAEEVIPSMQKIGDVAATLGVGAEGIQNTIRALGQMRGKGKAAAQELIQISESLPGFSAVNAIASSLGITTDQAFKKMEKGAISADTAIAAILKGMENFPGAAGGMERQSRTLNGLLSTLKDTIVNTTRALIGIDQEGNIRAGSLFELVKKAIEALIPFLERLQPKLQAIGEWFVSHKVAVAAVAGVILGLFVVAVGALLAAIGSALVLLAEFAAAGAAIAALAYTIYANWQPIKAFFVNLWETIKNAAKNAWDSIKSGITSMIEAVKNTISDLPNTIAYNFGLILGRMYHFVNSDVPEFVKNLAKWFSEIPERASTALDNLWVATSSKFKAFQEKASNWAKETVEKIVQFFRDLPSKITDAIASIGDIAGRIKSTVTSKLGSAGISFLRGVFEGVQGKALGGPVTGGTPYLVGERGPELFVPGQGGRIVPNNQITNNNQKQSIAISINGPIQMSSDYDVDRFAQRLGQQLQLARLGV